MKLKIAYVIVGIILGGLTMAFYSAKENPVGVLLGFAVCSVAAYKATNLIWKD